jgi:hypothetical protein
MYEPKQTSLSLSLSLFPSQKIKKEKECELRDKWGCKVHNLRKNTSQIFL